MKITEIIVGAGRTFNHPYQQFANLRPGVTFRAAIEEGEDPEKATKDLQARAESLVEDHKNHLLDSLHKLHLMEQYESKVASLQDQIREAQDELEELRAQQQKMLPGLGGA